MIRELWGVGGWVWAPWHLWLIFLVELLVVLCDFLVLLVEVWVFVVDFRCMDLVVQYYLGFSLNVFVFVVLMVCLITL